MLQRRNAKWWHKPLILKVSSNVWLLCIWLWTRHPLRGSLLLRILDVWCVETNCNNQHPLMVTKHNHLSWVWRCPLFMHANSNYAMFIQASKSYGIIPDQWEPKVVPCGTSRLLMKRGQRLCIYITCNLTANKSIKILLRDGYRTSRCPSLICQTKNMHNFSCWISNWLATAITLI